VTPDARSRRRVEEPASRGTGDADAVAREILRQRAERLARPLATSRDDALEVVTFVLGGETYGVESQHVLEVFRPASVTPLPGASAPVTGLVAWRGHLLTLLDLRVALGLSPASLDDLGWVVVLGSRRAALGVPAGRVPEVRRVPLADVGEPAEGQQHRSYVRGVTRDAVLLLDGPRLLEVDGLAP
jgi:purine-binding chemotaxis protein CheW